MVIESTMYFALGALVASLLALMIIPLISRRTARLTRKRIEAATPMTLTEFKADKDQLRAEFAMSTRRLEMNVDTLRNRLSDQLNEINSKKANVSALKSERRERSIIVNELEEREEKLRVRILDLEKDISVQAQDLRSRDRELADSSKKLSKTQTTLSRIKKGKIAKISGSKVNGTKLSGDYVRDIDELSSMLEKERQRADQLEDQVDRLANDVAENGARAGESTATIGRLKNKIRKRDAKIASHDDQVTEAETHVAEAESRLNALLQQTDETLNGADKATKELTMQNEALEGQLSQLREQITLVEDTVLSDWDTERLEQSFMRERLNDIASNVSKLISEFDREDEAESETLLFDRVSQFADTDDTTNIKKQKSNGTRKNGGIASRMSALRDAQASS